MQGAGSGNKQDQSANKKQVPSAHAGIYIRCYSILDLGQPFLG